MKTISTSDLAKRLEAGPLALFDVRGDVDFDQGHIDGAKSAPLGSLVFRVVRVMNPDSMVVVYSGGEGCDLAAQAVERLENLGMKNVHVYEEGLQGWQDAGYKAVPSKITREHTWGEVEECRHIVVDRQRAYGGAFAGKPSETEAAGG
jgi:rhodanese-related sulfurtransferase